MIFLLTFACFYFSFSYLRSFSCVAFWNTPRQSFSLFKNLPSASAVIPSDSQMTRKNQSEPSVRRGLHFANDSTDSLAELQHDTKESASSPDAFTGTEKELTFIKTERLYDIDIESSDDSVDSDYSPEVAIPDFKEVTSEDGVQYDGPACNTRRRTRRGVH